MLAFARRLTGLLVALLLVAGLPLAAARASCVCDHEHEHGATAAEPHVCTSACTAATCPMHRKAAAVATAADRHDGHAGHASAATPAASQEHDRPARAPREGMSCSCAGDAQALVGQATVAGVLPTLVAVAAPASTRVALPSIAEAPLSLASPPPAPPPRA